MAWIVAILLGLIVSVVLVGFVLAHFGLVVLLALGLVALGRSLRRHGV